MPSRAIRTDLMKCVPIRRELRANMGHSVAHAVASLGEPVWTNKEGAECQVLANQERTKCQV